MNIFSAFRIFIHTHIIHSNVLIKWSIRAFNGKKVNQCGFDVIILWMSFNISGMI